MPPADVRRTCWKCGQPAEKATGIKLGFTPKRELASDSRNLRPVGWTAAAFCPDCLRRERKKKMLIRTIPAAALAVFAAVNYLGRIDYRLETGIESRMYWVIPLIVALLLGASAFFGRKDHDRAFSSLVFDKVQRLGDWNLFQTAEFPVAESSGESGPGPEVRFSDRSSYLAAIHPEVRRGAVPACDLCGREDPEAGLSWPLKAAWQWVKTKTSVGMTTWNTRTSDVRDIQVFVCRACFEKLGHGYEPFKKTVCGAAARKARPDFEAAGKQARSSPLSGVSERLEIMTLEEWRSLLEAASRR